MKKKFVLIDVSNNHYLLFVEFLSKIDEGRTVVLLENTFSTVNE
jgi:hypothetical protein